MSAANIIQLRQLLAEKFPGLRTTFGRSGTSAKNLWPTGIVRLDDSISGGLPKGALTEIIAREKSSGSALLQREMLIHAARENQIITLIDGNDSLDVTALDETILSRLLWIRCRSAQEALQAADLILRDRNLPLVLLDLKMNALQQLQKISATTWYRLQRLVEETSTVCVVFTPRAMVVPAQLKITLPSRVSFAALERDPDELLLEMKWQITRASQFIEAARENFAG